MLERLLNSAFATTALGFAAAATGLLTVACLLIGAANLLSWIARVF